MKAGATGCATCGHGASPRAADSGSASAAGKAAAATATAAKRAASVGGRFAIGCTLSAVGALVGAVIWYFVAVKSGYEVGYIAWGLGLAAGFGMIVGVRGQHELSGIAAAAIAAGGILAGKYMIFASFTGGAAIEEAMHGYDIAAHHAQLECFEKDLAPFSPECEEVQDRLEGQYDDMPDEQVERKYAETERWFTERWNDPKYVETYLIHALAQEAYEEELISTGGEDAEEEEIAFSKPTWDKHKAAAAKKVGDMSADSRLTEARRIADERDAARKAMIAALSSLISAKQGFFATMFDYMDIVFVLLALGSAYKLASGGGEAS